MDTEATIAQEANDVQKAEERLWTQGQVAAYLGVSERTLKRWIDGGYPPSKADPFPEPLPYLVIGGRFKFEPAEIRKWRAGRKRQGAA